MRVWRIPYSTNCERVALAAGVSGTALEWVDVDAYDRAPVREVSGQGRVPIAELGGEIVVGSLAIVERIAPELWPSSPRGRAEADVFLEWFERVWLHALGVIFVEIEKPDPDTPRIARAAARLDGSLDRFEALLDGREHLLASELTIADVSAFPFLKYASIETTPADDYPIHEEMARVLDAGGRPRLAAWIERVDAQPRG